MSTLEYLDSRGTVNFTLVPWETLNEWLSKVNGNPHVRDLRPGVNRGKVIEELEARSKKAAMIDRLKHLLKAPTDTDWREYENGQGFTHLEELLIYQPMDWRKQAREYLFRFGWNLSRESDSTQKRMVKVRVDIGEVSIIMLSPIHVVLFHPEISRVCRYEPLNFLLSYGVNYELTENICKTTDKMLKASLERDISPLDYFFEFQKYVQSYKLDMLREIGKRNSFPRLCLIKELDFSDIIGQRLAKSIIRESVVSWVMNRSNKKQICGYEQPLSMIFAGPSGNGKTELARWLAKLMNKPNEDYFVKIDCGKLTDDKELFGMSGAYQGAGQGSALNNFVLRMSTEPGSLGIVLLDEIEKAERGVIHGLYQVLDKGEWTNKKLVSGKQAQTETICCGNIIFILTTNCCDNLIVDFVKKNKSIYAKQPEEMQEYGSELEEKVNDQLQHSSPFTAAFVGRVGRIVPFLPMANGNPDNDHPLNGEMMTVAKLLIERQQEQLTNMETCQVEQILSSKTKHKIAKIIVKEANPAAGVRSIQKGVERKMQHRIQHALLLEDGGIQPSSQIHYYAKEEERLIDFRVTDNPSTDKEYDFASDSEEETSEEMHDEDIYA